MRFPVIRWGFVVSGLKNNPKPFSPACLNFRLLQAHPSQLALVIETPTQSIKMGPKMKRSAHTLTCTHASTASQKIQRNGRARLAWIKFKYSGSQNATKFGPQRHSPCQHIGQALKREPGCILARLVVLVWVSGQACQHMHTCATRNAHGIPRRARPLTQAHTPARCKIESNVNNGSESHQVSEYSLMNPKIKTGRIIARHVHAHTCTPTGAHMCRYAPRRAGARAAHMRYAFIRFRC